MVSKVLAKMAQEVIPKWNQKLVSKMVLKKALEDTISGNKDIPNVVSKTVQIVYQNDTKNASKMIQKVVQKVILD